jgi:PIN domain nuclease of toxin-antitoxin system
MVVKVQLGKLALRSPLPEVLSEQQANGVRVLSATAAHVLAVARLPPIHRDPFDRLLVAEVIVEEAAPVTTDPILHAYPVRTIW